MRIVHLLIKSIYSNFLRIIWESGLHVVCVSKIFLPTYVRILIKMNNYVEQNNGKRVVEQVGGTQWNSNSKGDYFNANMHPQAVWG